MIQKILIPTGDDNGVGLEVSLKALRKLQSKSLKRAYILVTSKPLLKEHLLKLNIRLNLSEIKSLDEVKNKGLYILNDLSCLNRFTQSVHFAEAHPNSVAVVTGPMSKKYFTPVQATGHTDYLVKKYPKSDVFMTFIGHTYNVLLLTDHCPLNEVSNNISKDKILKAAQLLKKYNQHLKIKKPIALLGLNPHAGEQGLIGKEETSIHNLINLEGPLPADSFFDLESYKKYSFLIANYHDQGLIPFKLVHGFNASQTSLGLPFVRTSVCHGTAENLYLKNIASETSMLESIQLAINLLKIRSEDEIQR